MQFNQSEGIGGYMEYFVLWIKNIAVFYILATLIKNIVPDEKYGKYIKLFLGIIFIVLLLVLDIRLCLLVVLPIQVICLAVLLWRRKAPKKQAYASRPPEKHLG